MKDKKEIILQYSITAVSATLVVFLMLYVQGFWLTFELEEKYKILADAFTVPGVLLMMVAGLIWISSEGFFDGLTYAVRQFSGMLIPAIGKKYKHLTYYDYKTQRQNKRLYGYLFLFVVGLLFTVIAIVFVILFNSVYVPTT